MTEQAAIIANLIRTLPPRDREEILCELLPEVKKDVTQVELPKPNRDQQILDIARSINQETRGSNKA